MEFNADNPAFADGNMENGDGLTKREYIQIEVFKACCQNPHLIAALSPLGADGLTSTMVRKSIELADEFIKALSVSAAPTYASNKNQTSTIQS